MRQGVRGKLFLVALALTLAVLVPGGVYLEAELRHTMRERIERELQHDLAAARVLFESDPVGPGQAEIDPLADRMGEALGCRVTVMDSRGRVLGDSEVPLGEISSLENHLTRPEVADAVRIGDGRSSRHSSTVGADMLYLATPFRGRTGGGIVRVAEPLVEIDQAVARLRWLLLFAGLLSLALGVVLSAVAAQLMSRTLRDLVDSAHALAGGSPEPSRLAGSLQRMSQEIERTVAALAEERARFEAVLEGMSEGVVALDREGRVTLMNRAAHELLGTAADQVIGRSLIELVRVPALDELARAREAGTAELELPATRRRVLARLAPRGDGHAVVVLHDVTALHRLENIRRDFVANASHELRTPISVISANAETLRAGALSDDQAAPVLIDAIHRNAVRLTSLIGDLLDLSRLEAGRYRMDLEEVVLATAARRAVESVERIAERRRSRIDVDVPPDLVATADASALHQVLVNLIDNAVKHGPEGTAVTVAALARGDRVRLEVRDDGRGIPASDRRRIFERFYRIDPGRSRDMGGTGLGLSIVKHLVETMGGAVGVTANRPCGSIFWVELPGADAPAPPAA